LTEVTWKWLWKADNSRILCVSLLTRLWLAGGGTHVTENDVTRLQVTESHREVTSLTGSHLEVAVEAETSRILCVSLPTKLLIAGKGSHGTENDVT